MYIDDNDDSDSDIPFSNTTSSSPSTTPSSTPPSGSSPPSLDAQAIYALLTSHRTTYNISCCACENTILDVKKLHNFRCCICSHGRCNACSLEKVRRGKRGEVRFKRKGWGEEFWGRILGGELLR